MGSGDGHAAVECLRAVRGPSPIPVKRVAAYCRVSTSLESQQLSLESQMTGFRQKIAERPDMTLVGIYADEGITGTSARRRTEFLRMIEDAENGRIDYIVTKSISRFARNTVECLSYVRHLKEIGVDIYFEKEGVDTGTAISEMLLTVLAAFAQEESRSISENLKWGIRKRYEMGKGRWTPTYGFRLEGEKVVLEMGEAAIVRRIFELYRRGRALSDIASALNGEAIPSPRGRKWSVQTLTALLKNEKYAGDLHLQKWVTIDHISHKSVRNDATEIPIYCVKNGYPAVVERRIFEQVQRIFELKAPRGETSRYPYADCRIVCPFCGSPMVTRIMHVQARKKAVCCFGEGGCGRFAVKAWMLEKAIFDAWNGNRLKTGQNEIQEAAPKKMEYYFLDEQVEQVAFARLSEDGPPIWEMDITWKDGNGTAIPLPMDARGCEEPTHVAALYRTYLARMRAGEYVPARPTNQREKRMKEGDFGEGNGR